MEDIVLFYSKNEVTHLYTFDQKSYILNKTLDEVQQIVGDEFYCANRPYIVNRNAVQNAAQYWTRKGSITRTIPFEETITVSKGKISDFLEWLSGHL